jgi:hypothetical protein
LTAAIASAVRALGKRSLGALGFASVRRSVAAAEAVDFPMGAIVNRSLTLRS